jgi:tRNA dimethylallyltransferase
MGLGTGTLVVIVGPTAIGKTEMAIRLAQTFSTEIVSADSRQFYREMSIGTAKPTPLELSQAKHHFIDSHSITDEFNVGDYEAAGLDLLSDLFQHHKFVILVGGSGLYVDAICRGFDELPKGSPGVREQLNLLFANEGLNALQSELAAADPVYYQEVDRSNPHRLIRALEVFRSTGQPFSSFRRNAPAKRPFNILKIGLNTDRSILYDRINRRVDQMVEHGLVEEVHSLLPYRHLNPLNTVGYFELFDYFDGKISLDQAIEMIKQDTRRFAKRQLTWFRRSPETHWFDPGDFSGVAELVRSAE